MQRVISTAWIALPVSLVVAAGSACQLERFFPADVASGAARLSVRNTAKLISFIDADDRCGFSSDAVLANYTQEGQVGQPGVVTWTVTDCTLDFGSKLSSQGFDCTGVETLARGRAVVSATRRVEGLLTGNPAQPVIPQSPDAATIVLDAVLTDYEVRFDNRVTGLTIQEGVMHVETSVHLAQSASLGVCSVSTSDITLDVVTIQDAVFTLDTGDSAFDADVPNLAIRAQLGSYAGEENTLSGTVTVWDSVVDLNAPGGPVEDGVLDPDYDATEFRDAYACKDDLKLPVEFVCLPLTDKLAEGAARLSVNNIGNLVSTVVGDTTCGFASPAALASAQVTGTVGRDGGEVVTRVEGCRLDFGEQTLLKRDCLGKTSFASGAATFSGTMRVRGRLTGDPLQPVIPSSTGAVEIAFDVAYDGFSVSDDQSTQRLEVVTGGIRGTMVPSLGLDSVTGACSIATPNVRFRDLTLSPATVVVHADGNALELKLGGGTLNAQSGRGADLENHLQGSLLVGDKTLTVPLSGATLDPAYDAAAYEASYRCTPGLVAGASDDTCDFTQVIGDGVARLVVQTAGTLASLVNSNSSCGFEDTFGVLLWPTEVIGDEGDLGSMTWEVLECAVGQGDLFVQAEDCTGGRTYMEGSAVVDATRTVTGERTSQYLLVDAIEPRDRQEVTIDVRSAVLDGVAIYGIAAGTDEPQGILTVHSGELSAVVEPILGENAENPGTYDVATPLARLSNVRLRNATATLESQGKRFDVTIADTALSAQNGVHDGTGNTISGSVIIDGKSVAVGGALNPAYDQAAFDASYQCTENLVGLVPAG